MSTAPREWDARSYDRVPQPQERWGSRILRLIELAGDELVLEAGCGTGRDSIRLLPRLPSGGVIALDGSERMLQQLRARMPAGEARIWPVKADLRHPLPLRRVDAIFSVATFHWIPNHDALFANLAVALKRGGQLAADFGGKGNIARVQRAVASLWGAETGPWNFATVDETRQRLTKAGFVGIDVTIHDDPAVLAPGSELEQFLETVVLGWHLQQQAPAERKGFVRAIAKRIPDGEIDYVRLTVNARRGG